MSLQWEDINNVKIDEVIEASHNGIVTINKEEQIIIFNRAAEKIIGLKKEDVIHKKITDIIPSSGLPEIIRSGLSEYAQTVSIGNISVITNRTPIYRNGEVVGAVGVFQDVTELQSLREQLSRIKCLNTQLEAIIESSFDGIGVIGQDGTLLKVNKAYEQICGLPPEDNGVGRNILELQESRHVYPAVGLMVFKEKRPITVKQKIKTGKEVLITGTPVFKEDNKKIALVVCNIRDMTELNNLKAQAQSQVKDSQDEKERVNSELKELRAKQVIHDEIIVNSSKMRKVLDLVQRVSLVDSNILITGETGVGKEVVAKLIHKASPRCKEPFITINCGAIPENLLESELFGYEEGAFTGARKGGKMGIFELCNEGTILLDEIGEIPLQLQVKLLRAIQEQEIFRIGASKARKIDVRILAACNKDLLTLVEKNEFRDDLYYRLNVVNIQIPPLRERIEDIIPLSVYFLEKYNTRYKEKKRLDPSVFRKLEQYDWPGNIRELENYIEKLVVTSKEDLIKDKDIYLAQGIDTAGNTGEKISIKVNEQVTLNEAREILEKEIISKALNQGRSTRKVAKILGVTHPTVINKIQRYGLKQVE